MIITHSNLHKLELPYFQGDNLKNTMWFKQAALHKTEFGVYCKAKPGTKEYDDYWDAEVAKCWTGVTIGDISITGYMYHYLNYSTIKLKKRNELTNQMEELYDTPDFWKIHYDWFWSVEIAEKGITPEKLKSLHLHVKPLTLDGNHHIVCLKPRRAGFSYIAASMLARDFSCYSDNLKLTPKTCFALAYDEDFLLGGDGLLTKAWDMLDYHNAYTEGGLRHLKQDADQMLYKKARYKDMDLNVYYTTGGTIIGRAVKENRQTRGTSGYKIYLEELGSFKNIDRYYRSIQQTVEEGGQFTGQIIGFGTGGDKNDFIEPMKEFWYNPSRFNMMVFDNSQFEVGTDRSGFFFSATYVHRETIDIDGNFNLPKAEKELNSKRQKFIDDIAVSSDPSKAREDFMRYKAEQCFVPSEAFMTINVSIFNQDKLAEQSIKIDEKRLVAERGDLQWIYNGSAISGVKFEPSNAGKVLVLERPSLLMGDNIDSLYIAGIDGIDMGTGNSLVGESGSKFAMLVKKRITHFSDPFNNTYVALYLERPFDERDAYEIALKLAIWYNAKINLEYTKKEIIAYFRQPPGQLQNQEHRFSKEPKKLMDASILTHKVREANKQRIGTTADQKTNNFMDGLIKEYVQDFSEKLWLKPLIQELLNYNPDARTRYDAIVAMGLTELLDRELDFLGILPKSKELNRTKEELRFVRNSHGGYSKKIISTEKSEVVTAATIKSFDRYNASTLYGRKEDF